MIAQDDSFGYSSQAIARLTGLTLNPETPPHQQQQQQQQQNLHHHQRQQHQQQHQYQIDGDMDTADADEAMATTAPATAAVAGKGANKGAGPSTGARNEAVAAGKKGLSGKEGIISKDGGEAKSGGAPSSAGTTAVSSTSNNTGDDSTVPLDDSTNPTSTTLATNTHDQPIITIRSLVTTKEAGVIIGKGGKNVAEVRQETGVKAGVSKVIAGVHERVLTVSGTTANIAKAYSMMAQYLLENPLSVQPAYADCTTIRLLVSHQLVGSIIGKGGAKIKEIQEESGAKLVISKEMLPQSTERVIDVFGPIESIKDAILSIAECIFHDQERAVGTILYSPQVRLGLSTDYRTGGGGGPMPRTGRFDDITSRQRRWDAGSGPGSYPQSSSNSTSSGFRRFPTSSSSSNSSHSHNHHHNNNHHHHSASNPNSAATAAAGGVANGETQTQTLSVPVDMVGCIIGKGGSFINTIRRHSNARLHIAEPEQGSNERIVTITGASASNDKALQMIYDQLEAEKTRRINSGNDAEE